MGVKKISSCVGNEETSCESRPETLVCLLWPKESLPVPYQKEFIELREPYGWANQVIIPGLKQSFASPGEKNLVRKVCLYEFHIPNSYFLKRRQGKKKWRTQAHVYKNLIPNVDWTFQPLLKCLSVLSVVDIAISSLFPTNYTNICSFLRRILGPRTNKFPGFKSSVTLRLYIEVTFPGRASIKSLSCIRSCPKCPSFPSALHYSIL